MVRTINLRPNAGNGLWLMFLLPIALITSQAKYQITSSSTYKLSTIFSLGLISTCALIVYNKKVKNVNLKSYNIYLLTFTLITSILFFICLKRGLLFSLLSGFFSTILFNKIYWICMERLPKCFTLGEAAICTQAATLLLYCTLVTYYESAWKFPQSDMEIATSVIQIGLLGIYLLASIEIKVRFKSASAFFITSAFVITTTILLPLHGLLGRSPLLWIGDLIVTDVLRYRIVPFWGLCSVVAILVIRRQINKGKSASTSSRKIFHILAVVVFVPGLIYNCSFLYLASGVVLGIFMTIEVIRVGGIPPLCQLLENGFTVFSDGKDAGIIALTPIYLLVGCSLPLWIHPSPCDVTNSATFNLLPLLSGILTIGIGDTAASVIGSKFGRFQWNGSSKTIEGTIACVLSQTFAIYVLIHVRSIRLNEYDLIKIASAIVVTSVIEAKTDQVDNLVLPLVMYIMLI